MNCFKLTATLSYATFLKCFLTIFCYGATPISNGFFLDLDQGVPQNPSLWSMQSLSLIRFSTGSISALTGSLMNTAATLEHSGARPFRTVTSKQTCNVPPWLTRVHKMLPTRWICPLMPGRYAHRKRSEKKSFYITETIFRLYNDVDGEHF